MAAPSAKALPAADEVISYQIPRQEKSIRYRTSFRYRRFTSRMTACAPPVLWVLTGRASGPFQSRPPSDRASQQACPILKALHIESRNASKPFTCYVNRGRKRGERLRHEHRRCPLRVRLSAAVIEDLTELISLEGAHGSIGNQPRCEFRQIVIFCAICRIAWPLQRR